MDFGLINDITFKKEDMPSKDPSLLHGSAYSKFLVDLMLSRHMDTVLFADETNSRLRMSNKAHFYYLFFAVPKKKRFARGAKPPKIENLDLVKQYYGYNNERALEVMDLLSEEDIAAMKDSMYYGGSDPKPRKKKPKKK